MYIRLSNEEIKQAVFEFIQKRFNEKVELNSLVIKSPRNTEGYYAEVDITLSNNAKTNTQSILDTVEETTKSIIDKGKEIAESITSKLAPNEPEIEEEEEEEEPYTQPSPSYDDTGSEEDEEEDAIDKLINKARQ